MKKKKVIPAKGIITINIPVGNLAPNKIPGYLKEITKNFQEAIDAFKAAKYQVLILPIRPDGSGPIVNVNYL